MAVCWFGGLTTLDVVHRGVAAPGRNQKVTATRQDVAAGGPAANAAVTAAALGVRAVLVTALGQGPVAAAARADLEAHGVEVLDVAAPDFPLAVSAVLVDEATGERSVVSADGSLAIAPAPADEALAALPRPDAVLLDGHHPAVARAVLAFVQAADPRPRLVLDAGRYRPVFDELLPHADIAALSDDFRLPAHPGVPVPEAVLATGAGAVVITHGPAPVEWHVATATEAATEPATDDDAAGTRPAPSRPHRRSGAVAVPRTKAKDTLGAGDAFHGAVTAVIAQGGDLPHAIEAAVRVASTRVGIVGPREWLTLIP